jgi:hypothetical protein
MMQCVKSITQKLSIDVSLISVAVHGNYSEITNILLSKYVQVQSQFTAEKKRKLYSPFK